MFWVSQSGSIGIFSYAGNVHFGITVDQGIQACPNAIMDYFHNSFYELAEAAGIELETPAKPLAANVKTKPPRRERRQPA